MARGDETKAEARGEKSIAPLFSECETEVYADDVVKIALQRLDKQGDASVLEDEEYHTDYAEDGDPIRFVLDPHTVDREAIGQQFGPGQYLATAKGRAGRNLGSVKFKVSGTRARWEAKREQYLTKKREEAGVEEGDDTGDESDEREPGYGHRLATSLEERTGGYDPNMQRIADLERKLEERENDKVRVLEEQLKKLQEELSRPRESSNDKIVDKLMDHNTALIKRQTEATSVGVNMATTLTEDKDEMLKLLREELRQSSRKALQESEQALERERELAKMHNAALKKKDEEADEKAKEYRRELAKKDEQVDEARKEARAELRSERDRLQKEIDRLSGEITIEKRASLDALKDLREEHKEALKDLKQEWREKLEERRKLGERGETDERARYEKMLADARESSERVFAGREKLHLDATALLNSQITTLTDRVARMQKDMDALLKENIALRKDLADTTEADDDPPPPPSPTARGIARGVAEAALKSDGASTIFEKAAVAVTEKIGDLLSRPPPAPTPAANPAPAPAPAQVFLERRPDGTFVQIDPNAPAALPAPAPPPPPTTRRVVVFGYATGFGGPYRTEEEVPPEPRVLRNSPASDAAMASMTDESPTTVSDDEEEGDEEGDEESEEEAGEEEEPEEASPGATNG